MSENEIKEIAKAIAAELHKADSCCHLTQTEQEAVRTLLNMKKKTVKTFIWIVGALVLLAITDIYKYIVDHIHLIFK